MFTKLILTILLLLNALVFSAVVFLGGLLGGSVLTAMLQEWVKRPTENKTPGKSRPTR